MTIRNVGNMRLATPGDREIVMSRVFDAPRALVYEAFVTPELLKQWLGVRDGWKMTVCEIDLRVGGKYRYAWEGSGMKMAMGGEYREVVPLERIVATEQFDDPWYPGGAVGATTFAEHAGKTTVTMSVTYASKQARDAMLKTPMERGVAAGFDALAEILARRGGAKIDPPQIVQTQAQLTAVIHLQVPRERMKEVFAPAMNELLATLAAQGIEPKSAAFAYHLRMPKGMFDFELGFVVEDTVVASGRVKASQLPATKVARTVYHGGYEGLPDAWNSFEAWMKSQDLKHDEGLWELYLVGPQSTSNEHEFQTQLNRPLLG